MMPPPYDTAWKAYAAELHRRRVKQTSIDQYQIRLATWTSWLEGRGVPWDQAGPDDLDAFCDRACRPGAVHAGWPLAPATQAMYARMVCDFHRVLYAHGVLPADPMAAYVPPADPEPDAVPLELDDVAKLLAHVHGHPDRRLEPMVGLCYFEALRAGETALLRTGDVQLHAGVPKLAVLGKGRVERTWLPMHPALVDVLGAYTYWLAGQAGTTLRGLPAGTPLLQSRTCPGRPVGRSWPSRLLSRAMRDAGVDGRPHDLRRTAAHQVGIAFGDNPGPLQYVLRHRGVGALKHYRRPGLGEGRAYFEQVPDPRTTSQGGQ